MVFKRIYVIVFLVLGNLKFMESMDFTNDGATVTVTFDEGTESNGEYLNVSVRLPHYPFHSAAEGVDKRVFVFRKATFTRLRMFTFHNDTEITDLSSGSDSLYKSDEISGLLLVVYKSHNRLYNVRGYFCLGAVKFTINSAYLGVVEHVRLSRCEEERATMPGKLSALANIGQVNQRKVRHTPRQAGNMRQKSLVPEYLRNSREKRAALETYTVELLIVVDYEAYTRWNQLFGRETSADPLEKINQYYSYVFNGIDLRFRSIQAQQPTINMALAGFVIAQTEEESFWTSTSYIEDQVKVKGQRLMINASEALEKFQTWLDENTVDLPQYDHAILFTGGDLTYAGNTGNTGLAFAESMCRNISNSSIVEEAFDFRTVTFSTRQIARSLGARDDMDNNDCLEFFNFIMAPKFKLPVKSFPENRWKFSTCTEQYFNDYLSQIKEDGLNCLQETALEKRYPEEVIVLIQELPGVVYTAKQQCQNSFGPRSDICRSRMKPSAYAKLCTGLLCTVPGSDDCSYILPAEGTPCGNMKYCFEGQCLEFDDAEQSLDNCAFGDDPNEKCIKRISNKPFLCYTETVRYSCCASCSMVKIDLDGCEYGDRRKSCQLKDCQADNNTVGDPVCCRTCADGPVPALPSPEDWVTSSTTSTSPTSTLTASTMSGIYSPRTDNAVTDANFVTTTTAKEGVTDGQVSSNAAQNVTSTSIISSSSIKIDQTTSDIVVPVLTTEPYPSAPSKSSSYTAGTSISLSTERPTSATKVQSTTSATETPSTSSSLSISQTSSVQLSLSSKVPPSLSILPSKITTTMTSPTPTGTTQIKPITVSSLPPSTSKPMETTQLTSTIYSDIDPETSTMSLEKQTAISLVVATNTVNSPKPDTDGKPPATQSAIKTRETPITTATELPHSPSVENDKVSVTTPGETKAAKPEPCASGVTLDKPPETITSRSVETTTTKPVDECPKLCKTDQEPSGGSGHTFSMYDRVFFKELARSMRQYQRQIQQRVKNSVKHLYLGVTRQIRRHQESDTESIIYKDVVNPRSEIPSQDDDDMNRLLIPVWRRQHAVILRNVARDVQHMRYRVLMMVNRHLRH